LDDGDALSAIDFDVMDAAMMRPWARRGRRRWRIDLREEPCSQTTQTKQSLLFFKIEKPFYPLRRPIR